MFVTTHTIVATTIVLKTGNPWIYIPAAIINHPILDALPHFGSKKIEKSPYFNMLVFTDAIFGIGFFIFFLTQTHFPPLQLFMLDFMAGWPDLILFYNRYINPKIFVTFQKYHSLIQKLENPYGILLEIAINIFCLHLILYT